MGAAQNVLAVIIPIAPGDDAWHKLLSDLAVLDMSHQIALVFADQHEAISTKQGVVNQRCEILVAETSRAKQLNAGVRATQSKHLWFVHADTRLCANTITGLHNALNNADSALRYFNLAFSDGGMWMRVTEWGALWRCRLWKLPFGDQGFLLSRALFEQLGQFDESAGVAEDHALVWAAKRAGVKIVSTGARIETSARRYIENGWWATTWLHLRKTWLQARDYSRMSAR